RSHRDLHSFPTRRSSDLGTQTGGGEQRVEFAPTPAHDSTTATDTNVATETEMINNRPTPDRVDASGISGASSVEIDLGHGDVLRSEEHTSELQSLRHLVC